MFISTGGVSIKCEPGDVVVHLWIHSLTNEVAQQHVKDILQTIAMVCTLQLQYNALAVPLNFATSVLLQEIPFGRLSDTE